MRIKLRAGRDFGYDAIKMVILHNSFHDPSNEFRFAMPPIREEHMVIVDEGIRLPYFADLSLAAAQELADDLWECGIRPKQNTLNENELQATKRHLQFTEDMIRFLLKIPKTIGGTSIGEGE